MHGNFTAIDAAGVILIALALLIVMLPPKWDPAIRLKERLATKGDNRGKTLIEFSCEGCMAHDWRELNRGKIIGKFHQRSYDGGAGTLVGFYLVEREDGSRFDVLEPHCQSGTAEMQPRTDNPDEPLEGKIVCLH